MAVEIGIRNQLHKFLTMCFVVWQEACLHYVKNVMKTRPFITKYTLNFCNPLVIGVLKVGSRTLFIERQQAILIHKLSANSQGCISKSAAHHKMLKRSRIDDNIQPVEI